MKTFQQTDHTTSLVLQPQFQLMLRETTLIMTTLGTGLVPPAPPRPGQHMV